MEKITKETKKKIRKVVNRVLKEYGQALKMLAKE